MEAALQRRIQRHGWDRAVDHYERLWSSQLKSAQERLVESAQLKPGARVLEISCGTGLVTWPLAARVGSTGKVIATDISERMVARTAAEAVSRGLSQVSCRRMGAESIEEPDASFDAVVCALGLMYVPEVATALGEMYRVLLPGGRAAAAVWGARAQCGWAEVFPIVESRVASDVCPMFFHLGTHDTLANSLARAGFVNVRADRLASTLEYESAEDAADAAFVGGPVALAYARFDDTTRLAARREYLESIAAYRFGQGYRVPGEFVVGCGEKPLTDTSHK
jgi:ubiquinone/menaquinone biosynthesis C-methylase UbiE